MTDKYNKYIIGKLVFDKEKKRHSPLYFDGPILEKIYIEKNNQQSFLNSSINSWI